METKLIYELIARVGIPAAVRVIQALGSASEPWTPEKEARLVELNAREAADYERAHQA